MTEQEAKETNKQLVCEIKIDTEILQKIIDEKVAQIKLDIQEIRNQAIDEFAHRIRSKVMDEIDDCADELDWIDEIAEQMKAGVDR